jgi:hypothetical protein
VSEGVIRSGHVAHGSSVSQCLCCSHVLTRLPSLAPSGGGYIICFQGALPAALRRQFGPAELLLPQAEQANCCWQAFTSSSTHIILTTTNPITDPPLLSPFARHLCATTFSTPCPSTCNTHPRLPDPNTTRRIPTRLVQSCAASAALPLTHPRPTYHTVHKMADAADEDLFADL